MNKFIQTTFNIFTREILSYFSTPVAYVFIAIFLILSGFLLFILEIFLN